MKIQKLFTKIRPTYVFNLFAIILIIISIVLGNMYEYTQKEIIKINHNANMEYVYSLSNNLKKDIKRIVQKDFLNSMRDDTIAREYIESNLKLFVTTKYKYIYLVSKLSKESNQFIYLTNTQNMQAYKNLEQKKYLEAWNLQKAQYFKSDVKNTLWATYISPIIVDNNVEALLVIKFSLQEQNTILLVLKSLGNLFETVFVFFIFIFISIIWFSIIDKRREEQKNIVFEELQKSNAILNETSVKLQIESDKIKYLNDSLEKRVKEEVNKNRAKDIQLIHQSRLAQMGEMLSMIAHQWRQPLNIISATSTSLNLKTKLGKLDDAYVVKMTNNIIGYVEHLSETIDDFRNFFKPNKEKTNTNYRELIESVEKLIALSLKEKNIEFSSLIECEENLWSYPNELKHVILNLVKNAEDALLEQEVKKPYIKIHTYKKNSECILEVRDNAGGIDSKIIKKIFDPYFSTKLEKDGTGLGLYMSKMIIEEHCHGEIIVSNDEHGAVFKLILGKDYV